MNWSEILNGAAGAAAIGAAIKAYELINKRRTEKDAVQLQRSQHMSVDTEQNFQRSWTSIEKLWERLDEKDKQVEALLVAITKAGMDAAKVPELERLVAQIPELQKQLEELPRVKERLQLVEAHFRDCANILARWRAAVVSSPDNPLSQNSTLLSDTARVERRAEEFQTSAGKPTTPLNSNRRPPSGPPDGSHGPPK